MLAAIAVGCGGGSNSSNSGSTGSQTTPQIAGSWEIIATSNQPPAGVANLQTRIETGLTQNGGSVSATNPQLVGLKFSHSANDFSAFEYQIGGFCQGNFPTVSLTGTIDATNNFTFTMTENGIPFTGTGTLQTDGSITGTYTGGGTTCPDSGTFVANKAVSLTGNYINTFDVGDPSLTISLAEGSSSGALTAQVFDSTDGAFSLAGQAYGNAGQVSGTLDATTVTYYGLFTHDQKNNPLLIVVDQTFSLVGVLSKQ